MERSQEKLSPLFSIFATVFLLILLYLPRLLLPLLFSPVLISTLLLLTTLFHFGSSRSEAHPKTHQESLPQPVEPETDPETQMGIRGFHQKPSFSDDPIETLLGTVEFYQESIFSDDPKLAELETESETQMGIAGFNHNSIFCDNSIRIGSETEPETQMGVLEFHKKSGFSDSSVEWSRRRGPLEVIYEEYEREEEEEEEGNSPEYSRLAGIFPHGFTDSDTESDHSPAMDGWDSPENLCFRWEEEGEGMIEIALEEDNLIEIDISACR